MSASKQDASAARPMAAGCYVSVGPGGLVVSTGRRDKAGLPVLGLGRTGEAVVTVKDRNSGFAVRLDREEARQLAASLLRAERFLDEEEEPARPIVFPNQTRKEA